MTAPTIDSKPDVSTYVPGDADRFAHYYNKDRFDALEASLTGTPIVAVCGKTWVPQRDPQKFPLCPDCAAFAASLTH